MDEDLLRNEIYKRLGIEVGSLSSESGNDWQRAKAEILDEFKAKEFKINSDLKSIDYLTIDKDKEEYKSVLGLNSLSVQDYKVLIAQRNDLTDNEILKLIEYGNKEVMINIARYQILSSQAITNMLLNSVYLTKKNLIERQTLLESHKEILLNEMSKYPDTYVNLIEKLN